jgi:hypothetical protein
MRWLSVIILLLLFWSLEDWVRMTWTLQALEKKAPNAAEKPRERVYSRTWEIVDCIGMA